MPTNQISDDTFIRLILGAIGTIAFVLAMWILNGFRNSIKKLFEKTDDHSERIKAVESICDERHR